MVYVVSDKTHPLGGAVMYRCTTLREAEIEIKVFAAPAGMRPMRAYAVLAALQKADPEGYATLVRLARDA